MPHPPSPSLHCMQHIYTCNHVLWRVLLSLSLWTARMVIVWQGQVAQTHTRNSNAEALQQRERERACRCSIFAGQQQERLGLAGAQGHLYWACLASSTYTTFVLKYLSFNFFIIFDHSSHLKDYKILFIYIIKNTLNMTYHVLYLY